MNTNEHIRTHANTAAASANLKPLPQPPPPTANRSHRSNPATPTKHFSKLPRPRLQMIGQRHDRHGHRNPCNAEHIRVKNADLHPRAGTLPSSSTASATLGAAGTSWARAASAWSPCRFIPTHSHPQHTSLGSGCFGLVSVQVHTDTLCLLPTHIPTHFHTHLPGFRLLRPGLRAE